MKQVFIAFGFHIFHTFPYHNWVIVFINVQCSTPYQQIFDPTISSPVLLNPPSTVQNHVISQHRTRLKRQTIQNITLVELKPTHIIISRVLSAKLLPGHIRFHIFQKSQHWQHISLLSGFRSKNICSVETSR